MNKKSITDKVQQVLPYLNSFAAGAASIRASEYIHTGDIKKGINHGGIAAFLLAGAYIYNKFYKN